MNPILYAERIKESLKEAELALKNGKVLDVLQFSAQKTNCGHTQATRDLVDVYHEHIKRKFLDKHVRNNRKSFDL